ncbi:LysR family transcriptional regulator [Sphingomonas sp. BAUL-RG-20F-R05-02]|uniref:LysR family transcriptional regulator n=1 Tax=Sphingomonas sp. BAUL-RG-20F-R05-02 TaxID=2914830 RepID=UPI001F5685C4|nr:LysR family transcriptional regulator [Sphingomonas sp. BAUL-RG-20F-R05-02]
MLDRYLLRYFAAVVDHGNFSRAAAACGVSQPTLSVGIAKLERTVGHPLFVRSNQRVELTDAGARFLVHARRIEREFNAAADAMRVSVDLPSLRLGVLTSVPGLVVARGIAQSRPGERHRLELVYGSEREIVSHLAKGRIDVALTLVGRGAGRFMERVVRTEGYRLAIHDDHPLADEAELSPEQLASEVMIVRRHCEALAETSRFFTERGVRPHFALRSTNDERVLQMISAGLGMTVMPECYRHEGVRRPRLTGFTAQRSIGWIAAHHAEHLLAEPPPIMTMIEAAFGDLDT